MTQVFDIQSDVAVESFLETINDGPRVLAFKGKRAQMMQDYGTVLFGDVELDEAAVPSPGALVWRAPMNWTMAHVVARFGVFRSVSQARKNGWEAPPKGIHQHTVKIRKVLGDLWTIV